MVVMIDLETTGLDPANSRVWEIGALLTDNKFNVIGKFTARLWDEEIERQLIERCDQLPNLPPIQQIMDTAMSPQAAASLLEDFLPDEVLYAVAYNREFDQKFFTEEMTKLGFTLLPKISLLVQAPWLCAMRDVEDNLNFKCWKLGHLCLDKGIAVDPSQLHGALADIDLTAQMLRKTGVSAEQMFAFQSEPVVALRAMTVEPWKDNGASTALCKELGYSWEVPRGHQDKKYPKSWVKVVKQSKIEEEYRKAEGKFLVREIKEG